MFGYGVAAIIISNYSWEWVFYLFGMLGFFWFIFWNKSVTSFPENNKHIPSEELRLILKEAPSKESAPSVPFLKLITNLPFLAIVVATFCNNWTLYTFLSYIPTYVSDPVESGGMGIELESSLFIYAILL